MLWSPHTELHLPFQNTALDYSGHARHSTIHGSGVFATRPGGSRCLYFDGVGDYVTTPSFGLSGTVVWFAADVRVKAHATEYQTLIGDDAQSNTVGYLLCYRTPPGKTLAWQYTNGSAPAAANATNYFDTPYDDIWLSMLIVCDYSGKVTYFYRAGILFASVAMSGTPVFPTTNRAKYIGSYSILADRLTDGYLQNVMLGTFETMPPLTSVTTNAKRTMLGLHPIWSV
jgi:hypothetical protein